MRRDWHPYFEAPEASAGSGGMDIRAAFKAAFAQHAQAETSDDESADADPAPAEVPAEAEQDSPTSVAEPTPDSESESPLSSDQAFQALQQQHANDPAALRKALLGDYTKKTQALATERKAAERRREYDAFIDLLETDAPRAIREFARLNQIDLGASPTAPASTDPPLEQQVLADFKQALGPDLEYLGDALAPAVTQLVTKLAASTVDKTVQPLREQTRVILDQAASDQTQAVMASFAEKHPDWSQHEAAMLQYAEKLDPKGMSELEFLELLHGLATRDAWEQNRAANIDKEVARRVKQSVTKMGTADRGDGPGGTPETQVRKKAPEKIRFTDAYEAAKRGERWEDDD